MKIDLQAPSIDLTDIERRHLHAVVRDAFRVAGPIDLDAVRVRLSLACERGRPVVLHNREDVYRVTATVTLPGGVIHAEDAAPTLERAAAAVHAILMHELKERHARHIEAAREGARSVKAALAAVAVETAEGPAVEPASEEWADPAPATDEPLPEEEWLEAGEDERDFV